MSSEKNKKLPLAGGYSKKILTMLSEKPAVPVGDMAHIAPKTALLRSIKGLLEAGQLEMHHSGRSDYLRLTKEGRLKARSQKLDASNSLVNPTWDGKWRIVLLDVPEERKQERESLRYLLKKAGFACLKNSVWISPLPYEFLFQNIKKDLGLTTEIMIFVTDQVDSESLAAFTVLYRHSPEQGE